MSSASSMDPQVTRYRTTPDHETTGWPPGVPYIVGNEACERFSYYGMRAILYAHLVSLYVVAGQVADTAKDSATSTVHLFFAGVYALPMIGAIIADRLVGKYNTILYLSLVYCAGHAVLSIGENSLMGMYIGLGLIALGSGGIKPCVSANVGDQFGKNNWFRVRTIYQIFYFSINFGSFFSTLLIPVLKDHAGFWVANVWPGVTQHIDPARLSVSIAFGLPGVLMFIATFIFWLGRDKYIHVPPKPGGQVGLLDTLSSVSLFMIFGHLFVTTELPWINAGEHWPWWAMLGVSFFFLVLGLWLFKRRQDLEPDDGFLSITFFTVQHYFSRLFGKEQEVTPAPTLQRQLHSSEPSEDLPTPPGEHALGSDQIRAVDQGIQPGQSQQITDDAPPGAEQGIQDTPNQETSSTTPANKDPYDGPLAESSFWGPAVRRFGHEAAEGPVAVFKIITIFFLVSVFWALFDQHSSTWIEQAKQLNRTIDFPFVGTTTLKETQIPALNPLMVMLLIPLMNLIYVRLDKMGLETTPLRRVTVGMLVAAFSFVAVALIQHAIEDRGEGVVSVLWQIIPYLVITVAEVMVSITGLEFAYTQAPKRMKSTVMGFWLLTVTLGNVLVAVLAGLKGLNPTDFFWVFAGLMGGAGLLFGIRAYFYVPKDYAQE